MPGAVNVLSWFLQTYDDLLTLYPAKRVEVLRDKKHAVARIESEGPSFVTSTLPRLHNEALSALEAGRQPPSEPHLRWLLSSVWDHPDSRDAAVALSCHRQLCHILYKLELPYDDATKTKVIDRFVETESELADAASSFGEPSEALRDLVGRARYHVARVMPAAAKADGVTRSTYLREVCGMLPRHGPGAVATGEVRGEKWRFKRLYASIHARFPYYDWFVCRGRDSLLAHASWYRGLERLDYPVARVVLVPKDSRGPRLISEEPLELQFMQQGYSRMFTRWIRKSPARNHVLFDCQEKHRELALESSRTRESATLDLKDASDRVSVDLVRAVFSSPILEDLLALRSHSTTLPDGSVLPLRKYAPMGSSLCFPVMATTLWGLCCAAFEYAGVSATEAVDTLPYIFGDDVIVPSGAFDWVTHCLRLANLRVNESKSFARSYFRESCGCDAYYGIDITPVRLRTAWDGRSKSGAAFISWTHLANELRKRGFMKTAQSVLSQLSEVWGRLQTTLSEEDFPGVVVESVQELTCPVRMAESSDPMRANYQRPEAYALVPKPKLMATDVDEWRRLHRNLTQGPGEFPDKDTVRGPVRLKPKWVRFQPS